MDFMKPYDNKWSQKLEVYDPVQLKDIPESLHLSLQDWYTYSTSFSEDGRYLMFFDYHQPCVTHLAVFEILHGDKLSVRLSASFRARYGPLTNVKHDLFQPRSSLLVYFADGKVWAWNFKKSES